MKKITQYDKIKKIGNLQIYRADLQVADNDLIFELLEHNAIMDTFRQLYREEIGGTK